MDPVEFQGPDIKDNCLFYIICAIFFMSAVFMVLEFWTFAGRSIDELQLSIIPWTKLKTLRTISDPRRLNPTRTGSRSQLTYPISNPTQIFSVHSTHITDSFQALNMCKTSFEYSIHFILIYIFLYSYKFHSIITRFTSNFIITFVLSI